MITNDQEYALNDLVAAAENAARAFPDTPWAQDKLRSVVPLVGAVRGRVRMEENHETCEDFSARVR
jgi:hypothetical protein